MLRLEELVGYLDGNSAADLAARGPFHGACAVISLLISLLALALALVAIFRGRRTQLVCERTTPTPERYSRVEETRKYVEACEQAVQRPPQSSDLFSFTRRSGETFVGSAEECELELARDDLARDEARAQEVN